MSAPARAASPSSGAAAGAGCTAVAFERDESRRSNVAFNAAAFGVSVELRGEAPDAFDGAAPPIGDLRRRWPHPARPAATPVSTGCRAGGRLVANAVTVESEAVVAQGYSRLGGKLRRFQHYQGEPLGGFTGWRPRLPITQWAVTKP